MKGVRRAKAWLAALLAVLLLLPVGTLFLTACSEAPPLFRVLVLDVGQSDAILLSSGDHHMLIDTGTALARDNLFGALRQYGVEKLEYLLLTHEHEDHVGNARAVLEGFAVDQLLTARIGDGERGYDQALQTAVNEDCPHNVVEKGDSFSLGNATCEVLLAKGDADNDGSVVLRVSFGETVFLFMGDAGAAAEGALLYLYPADYLKCDVLKVGHHGSNTAGSEPFLQTVAPLFAAISCGTDNAHGLPHKDVLDRLAATGAAVDRTDLSGTLVYMSDGQEVRQLQN